MQGVQITRTELGAVSENCISHDEVFGPFSANALSPASSAVRRRYTWRESQAVTPRQSLFEKNALQKAHNKVTSLLLGIWQRHLLSCIIRT